MIKLLARFDLSQFNDRAAARQPIRVDVLVAIFDPRLTIQTTTREPGD
jgi:hypothetical protein